MTRWVLATTLCIGLSPFCVAAAEPDSNNLTPVARAVVALSRSCTDPTMAELFKDAFNRGTASRALNAIAVAIDDPSEVAADTALARHLDAQVPPRKESVAMRYCKARLKLNTAAVLPEIFRIEVQPDGRTTVVSVNLSAESFDDMAQSQTSPKKPAKTTASSAFHDPIVVMSPPPDKTGVLAQPEHAQISVTPAPPPKIAVAAPKSGKLPRLTVLCAAQSEFMLRMQDMAQPLPTHWIGPSCFFLERDTGFTPTGAQERIMAQVRLADGPHAGAVAWTERRLVEK